MACDRTSIGPSQKFWVRFIHVKFKCSTYSVAQTRQFIIYDREDEYILLEDNVPVSNMYIC